MSDIWLWVVFTLACCLAYWYLTVPSGLPPGTAGLPVVGCLPFMEPNLCRTFKKLGKKYGNLFHVYLGSQLIVILNDYTTMKEAFVKQGDIFAARPTDMFFKEDLGIFFADGEIWKQHRRFLLKYLKDTGIAKQTLGIKVMNEIHRLTDAMKQHNGKPFNINELFNCSFGNNVNILLTGKSYDYDSQRIAKFINIFENIKFLLKKALFKMFLPWVSHVPGLETLTKITTARNIKNIYRHFANQIIEEVKMDFKDGDSDSLIEAYLSEMNVRKDHNGAIFSDLELSNITMSLIAGASGTTSSTLTSAILYLANYPEVQKKVQKEIDEVIGREREVSYQDRINMPYTEATIYEIHRASNIITMSLPHRNIREATLFGYRIPSNTIILANIYNMHHDPEVWRDPENFRPDRFLDDNGQLVNTELVVPFSLGKRSCTGEPLARIQVFLYIVSLLQQLDFAPPNGAKPELEATSDFFVQDKKHIFCAIARQN